MKRTEIRDGEPVAYNTKTKTAVIKEVTDSSIEIFTVDTVKGKKLSPEIVLKPERVTKNGRPFFAFPTLLGGCVQEDGTIILLVNYENLLITKNQKMPYSEEAAESIDVLYVYEKGDIKNLKKYMFPQNEPSDGKNGGYFWEEPRDIQCSEKGIYLFSEKNYTDDDTFYHVYKPVRLLEKVELSPQKDDKNISTAALIVYDDIRFNYYSEKENAVYVFTRFFESKTTEIHILGLEDGYEIPEEPVEKTNGEFLFSETQDGRPLIFFVKTRTNIEEQKIELLTF